MTLNHDSAQDAQGRPQSLGVCGEDTVVGLECTWAQPPEGSKLSCD